jgi:transposase InsO family protein
MRLGHRSGARTCCGETRRESRIWANGGCRTALDDHSRYLLACTAFRRVGGDDVVATFTAAGDAHGWPAATLTDNGAVDTSRFTGGRNSFEYLLAYLGIRQKNGAPAHPQTQGKIMYRPCRDSRHMVGEEGFEPSLS